MKSLSRCSERIAEVFEEELGEDLRVVSHFSSNEMAVAYMRDDLREEYTAEEDEEILREMLLESIGQGRFTQLFGSELEATARIFEDQVVTMFPSGRERGVVVSVERTEDISYLDIVDECQQIIGK